jgi:hypothetical protein
MHLFRFTIRLVVISVFMVFAGAFSANTLAAKDDPFAPFRPKPGKENLFAAKPPPEPTNGGAEVQKQKPAIDPALDYLFRIDSGASEEEREQFGKLTPEQVDRVRTDYLERLDTEDPVELKGAMGMILILAKKVREWDNNGVQYDRDEMIDTFLNVVKRDTEVAPDLRPVDH